MKTDQTQIKRPRYMGIPTFMRAPFIEDLSEIDIALVGVPFDGGVTNWPGARHGPREVRNQSSLMRTIHPTTRQNPFDLKRIGTSATSIFPPFMIWKRPSRGSTNFTGQSPKPASCLSRPAATIPQATRS